MRAGAAALIAAALLAGAAAQAEPADMALVMAVDVSESVDAEEYELQHEGIARAFESPAVIAAITGGTRGAIDATVIEWSDPSKQVVTVDWTRVGDAKSAAGFAAKVRASRRSSNGLTAIGNALIAAAAAFERLADKPDRRVIDVSGDGMANIGARTDAVRDSLVAKGITINGLAILKTEPNVDKYYEAAVIGGDNAFLLQVEDFNSFAAAMHQKLLAEVAARPVEGRAAALQMQKVLSGEKPLKPTEE